MKTYSFYDAIRKRREFEAHLRDNGDESKKKVVEVAAHPETLILTRDHMPDPWVYVERLFPRIAGNIAGTKVYKNNNTAFLKNLGFPEAAGGLFFPKASTILICWSRDKFKDDVIVCHEMLHYADQLLGGTMRSREADENFAYHNSIKYLELRGYMPKWIAEEYMLPYYWGLEVARLKKKQGESITDAEEEKAKADAIFKCMTVIEGELYGKHPETPQEDQDRFDLI